MKCDLTPITLSRRHSGFSLNEENIKEICQANQEPEWLQHKRLEACQALASINSSKWVDQILKAIHLDSINLKTFKAGKSSIVPNIQNSPHQQFNLKSQIEGTLAYRTLYDEWEKQGVIICPLSEALIKYPDLVKKYLGNIAPPSNLNFFNALNSAAWYSGIFVYVPKNLQLDIPLQLPATDSLNTANCFNRSLIVIEENSNAQFIDGCSSIKESEEKLQAKVVEVVVEKRATFTHISLENWNNDIVSSSTKHARVEENAKMCWVDGSFGGKHILVSPGFDLVGDSASGQIYSIGYATTDLQYDIEPTILHSASKTSSKLFSRTLCNNNGSSGFIGSFDSQTATANTITEINTANLLLSDNCRSTIEPKISNQCHNGSIECLSRVFELDAEQLFYLNSRGLNKNAAKNLLIKGFVEKVVKEFPMEYSVEIQTLLAVA